MMIQLLETSYCVVVVVSQGNLFGKISEDFAGSTCTFHFLLSLWHVNGRCFFFSTDDSLCCKFVFYLLSGNIYILENFVVYIEPMDPPDH